MQGTPRAEPEQSCDHEAGSGPTFEVTGATLAVNVTRALQATGMVAEPLTGLPAAGAPLTSMKTWQ